MIDTLTGGGKDMKVEVRVAILHERGPFAQSDDRRGRSRRLRPPGHGVAHQRELVVPTTRAACSPIAPSNYKIPCASTSAVPRRIVHGVTWKTRSLLPAKAVGETTLSWRFGVCGEIEDAIHSLAAWGVPVPLEHRPTAGNRISANGCGAGMSARNGRPSIRHISWMPRGT